MPIFCVAYSAVLRKKWNMNAKRIHRKGNAIHMKQYRIPICILLAVMLLTGIGLYTSAELPDKYYTFTDRDISIDSILPVTTTVTARSDTSYDMDVKLMGFMPIKQVTVEILPETMLIPSGETFGIKFYTDGAVVVGFNDLNQNGKVINPAFEAGLRLHDVIRSADGQKIGSNEDLVRIITKSDGNPIQIEASRRGMDFTVTVTPIYDETTRSHKIGLLVRDSTAGIGTLTYFDPVTQTFAGLGHGISDLDTGELLPLGHAVAYQAEVNAVNKGAPGAPGELRGTFLEYRLLGTVYRNTDRGIYGQTASSELLRGEPIPIGLRQDVEEGDATVLCTVSGTTVQEYAIKILKVYRNTENHTKNMMIQITDENLINATGGIVQGMSGSPILQNGKLIGAITHVLVNDPQKGYGIFIENMLETAS